METTTTNAPARTAYRIKADSIEACSCNHGCNCQFAGFPNEGFCEFVIGYDVKEGRFGDIDLTGVRFVVAAKYPGAIHEGNGHVVLFVDPDASDEQVGALATILTGQAGGMPWEALAGTVGRLEGPIRTPVEIKVDGRRSSVRIAGAVDVQFEPLRNPVTGAENEVHIVYPNGGFFWNDGDVATTTTMRAEHGDFRLEWPGKYSSVAEVNWTNQPGA
jgi:hypothetical protein